MSIAVLYQAAAAVAIAALGVGPPTHDPIPPERPEIQQLIAQEGLPVRGALSSTDSEVIEMTLIVPPANGKFTEDESGTFFYDPNSKYFGRDRLVVEAQTANEILLVEFEIDVLPRYFPLIGRWQGGDTYHAGYYDSRDRKLVLCGEVSAAGAITCGIQALGETVPTGGIPVVLPTLPDQPEVIGIFQSSTGTMYRLTQSADRLYSVSAIDTYRDALRHFPVVGDWDGYGETLAFVDRRGNVVSYGHDDVKINWPNVFGTIREDQLTWPVRFPLGGIDAIALGEPDTLDFTWQTSGAGTGVDSISARLDIRRPIYWPGGAPTLGVSGNRVIFVLIQDKDGALSLWGYDFTDGKPSTIPITFPNDPPNG